MRNWEFEVLERGAVAFRTEWNKIRGGGRSRMAIDAQHTERRKRFSLTWVP